MAVTRIIGVKITCDNCGITWEEHNVSPTKQMDELRAVGWIGSHRKCYCAECAKNFLDTPTLLIKCTKQKD